MGRIFIAINLPKEIKEKLAKLQEEISQYLSDIRFTKPDNIHLTLVFLGEIKNSETQKVCKITKEAVEEIEYFTLKLKGLGVFPEARRVKILWVGVYGNSMLEQLNQSLYRKLSQADFSLDERAFTPHITIGRAKDKINKETVLFCLNKFKEVDFAEVKIKSIEVMESQLTESGPIYKTLKSISLANNE